MKLFLILQAQDDYIQGINLSIHFHLKL